MQSTIATTTEDDLSPGPEVTSDGELRIVADARLDNRADLARMLAITDAAALADESLIIHAYRRWGRKCGVHLRGDFAFIIWDDAEGIALACRDPLGVRSLAFARESDRIIIASTVGAVRAALLRQPKPNLDYLKSFLSGTDAFTPGPSAFDSIEWLPPGHQAEIRQGSFRVERYDQVRATTSRSRPGPDIYAEFRSRLTTAIESRLRAKAPIGFLVSGGFDSSSILCLANAAADAGRCHAQLRSYSAVYDRFSEADDRPYLTSVLESCRHVTATLMPWDDEPWSLARLDGRDGFPMEQPIRGPRSFAPLIAKRAMADGCRVMVSGLWADQLLFGSPYSFGELLWDLPLHRLAREGRYFFRSASTLALARSVVAGNILRFRRLAAELGISDPPVRAPGLLLLERFVHGRHAGLMVDAARIFKWVGAENRMPFLDRDLLEFVMGLASEYFFEQGQSKRLLRAGLHDLLPEGFQHRQHVASAGRFVFTAMKAERDEIAGYLRDPMVVEHRLVTPALVSRLLGTLWSDNPTGPIPAIQRLLAVEIWLRDQGDGRTTIPKDDIRPQKATRSAHNRSGEAS